jgi:hypothetical protein
MKRLLISIARVYQYTFSPLFGSGKCRYVPCCSDYFIEAVKKRGAIKGTALGMWRILRCNPFGGHGYDPVPEKKA